MSTRFTKMHGLGNDFVVFDGVRQSLHLDAETIRRIADRHFGIGCDQVLLVEPPESPDADFRYRIFNADGQEVEQCGNGARCFARFVHEEGLTDREVVTVETRGGRIRLSRPVGNQVTVDMGIPRLEPADIPFEAPSRQLRYRLNLDGGAVEIAALSMGNPHAVLQVDSVAEAPVEELGPVIERHPRFPQGVNVGFMEIVASGHIRLRVFERGVGETLACGSGACAAVVAGNLQGLLQPETRVDLKGGTLVISWPGEGQPVQMTGPAERVFEGQIDL
ncbi:MAG: diaminopimelate epimerase [Gammaproteobacteria bacterium]